MSDSGFNTDLTGDGDIFGVNPFDIASDAYSWTPSATTAPPSGWSEAEIASLIGTVGSTFAQTWAATHPSPANGGPPIPTSGNFSASSIGHNGGPPMDTSAPAPSAPQPTTGFDWSQIKDPTKPYFWGGVIVGLFGVTMLVRAASRK